MVLSPRHKYNKNNYKFQNKKNKKIFNEIEILNNSSEFENRKCIICDSNNFKIINEIDRYGFYYPTGICEICGMIQQSKYYKDKFLKKFYSEYYNLFYAHFKNPEDRFNSQFSGATKSYNFLKEFLSKKNTKILEIGCGAGGILKYYKNYGHKVFGLDLDEDQLNYGRNQGLNLINYKDYDDKKEKFDIIILSHALEHMSYPIKEIDKAKSLLNNNGIIYIEVPSIHSIKNLNYNYNIRNYFHIAHFLHFSKLSFTNFMNKNNLNILKINEDIQCIVSQNYTDNNFRHISSYSKDLKELEYIENYYIRNKIKLCVKKFLLHSRYKLILLIKNIIPKIILSFIKKNILKK